MNENINLTDILKDTPKGTKLWSPVCGECEVEEILPCDAYPIRITHGKGNGTLFYRFTSQGKLCNNSEAECVLFPSKNNRDWLTFKVLQKRKYFEPFQKILIKVGNRKNNKKTWRADLYCHYDEETHTHCSIRWSDIYDDEIIPYKGNEDKIGKQAE